MKMIKWVKMIQSRKNQGCKNIHVVVFHHLHQSNHLHLRPLFDVET